MIREPVKSSDLVSVGYDPSVSVLEVEFKNGGIYQYTNVSKNVYKELMTADSIGRYFNSQIRDKYPNSKL